MQTRPNSSTRKILLYGNSILIAGLACRLQEAGAWDVVRVEEGPLGELDGVELAAYDVRDPATAEVLPRLRKAPGLALVGLDALTDTVTVLSGQSRPAHSIQEVQELLEALMQTRGGVRPAAKDENELSKTFPKEVPGPITPS